MIVLTLEQIETLVTDVASECSCITRVGLYGSYARGEQHENSDVDLLYVCDNDAPDAERQVEKFMTDVRSACKGFGIKKVDLLSVDVLYRSRERFRKEVFSTVRWLYPASKDAGDTCHACTT